MNVIIENFWQRLEGILQRLPSQLLGKRVGYKFLVGRSNNDSFPLRAYLTFLKNDDGDELAITVDIKNIENGVRIESDIVAEDGLIVADGPTLEMLGDLSEPSVQANIELWFEEFQTLLQEKSHDISEAIDALK
tara:strand:- start:99 stop:500 length:402 start_codon:yes stop_codon:yes gene_type:complete